jgi:hypothetical protein
MEGAMKVHLVGSIGLDTLDALARNVGIEAEFGEILHQERGSRAARAGDDDVAPSRLRRVGRESLHPVARCFR